MLIKKTIAVPALSSSEDTVLTAHQEYAVRDKQYGEWLSIQKSRQKKTKKRTDLSLITYLLRKNEFEKALSELNNLFDRSGGFQDTSLYALMAKTQYALGQYDGAVRTCNKAFGQGVRTPALFNIKAKTQIAAGNYRKAFLTCSLAFLKGYYNTVTYNLLAEAQLGRGVPGAAIMTCRQALSTGLYNSQTFELKAKAEERLALATEAVYTCNKAIAKGFATIETYIIKARIQYARKFYTSVLLTCDEALCRKSSVPAIYILKAQALAAMGQFTEALETINNALAQGMSDLSLFIMRSQLLHDRDQRSSALTRGSTSLLPNLRALLAEVSALSSFDEVSSGTFDAVISLRLRLPADPYLDRKIIALGRTYIAKRIEDVLALGRSTPQFAHDTKLNRKEMYDRQEAADRKRLETFFSDSEKQFVALFSKEVRQIGLKAYEMLEQLITGLSEDGSAYAIYRVRKYEKLLKALSPEGLGLFDDTEFNILSFILFRNSFKSGAARIEHNNDHLSRMLDHYTKIEKEGYAEAHAEGIFAVIPEGLNIAQHHQGVHYGPARIELLEKVLALHDLLPDSGKKNSLYSMLLLTITARSWSFLKKENQEIVHAFIDARPNIRDIYWSSLHDLRRSIEEGEELNEAFLKNINAFCGYKSGNSGT